MNRKLIARALAVALTAWASVGSIPAAAPASPVQTPPATAPSVDPQLLALVRELGDADFATREKAQKQLELLPLTQHDALVKIAEASTDEEVKSRLAEQIGHMEERLATDPPPISVDLNKASYTQVAAAFSKAGIPLTSNAVPGDARFTLKADNQPFWEIVRQLAQQAPISMTADPPVLVQQTLPHHQIIRGIMISADDPRINNAGKVAVNITVALDPRIRVVDLHPLQVDDARDNEGHLLHLDAEPAAMLGGGFAGGAGRLRLIVEPSAHYFQSRACTFSAADGVDPGKTMTIKGTAKFLVTVAETTTKIADASKHLNEAIAIGDSKVTLRDMLHSTPDAAGKTRAALSLAIVPNDAGIAAPPAPNIELTPNGVSLKGNLTSGGDARMIIDNEGSSGGIFMGASPNATGEVTTIVVTDAKGKTVAHYTLPRGQPVISVHTLSDTFQEPLTFTFTAPTKTREVVVPFEFKDLPVQR